MDSRVNLWLDRAQNELAVAQTLYRVSDDLDLKKKIAISLSSTFYSSVINHAYYSIFYATRALLLLEGIEIKAPEIHNKAYNQFKQAFVSTGKLDKRLLQIYTTAFVRAQGLLEIIKKEKTKRADFVYTKLPQANKEPAEESLANAQLFLAHIRMFIQKSN